MLAKLEREVMLMLMKEKEGREENSFVVWVAVVLALVVVMLVFNVVVMYLVVRLMTTHAGRSGHLGR